MKLAQILFHQMQNVLFYVKERKCFVQNVLGSSYFIIKCNDDEYKMWAKTGVLVGCTVYGVHF
jgi:hypothetical protein